jgi:hypothetical protein
MSNVEKLIADWRKSMMAAREVGPETADELETHLREHIDQLVRSGMTESEAFPRAVQQLGGARMLGAEFQKLDHRSWWGTKLVAALGLLLALANLTFVIVLLNAGKINFLLAAHAFLVGMGYSTTFLVGALGVFFVAQRCFSPFLPFRSRSLTRLTFVLGCIAAGMTVAGVILGMLWAKIEWGRYWAWDIREIGAFAVVLWQVCFLFTHQFTRTSARGILMMSLLGNIVVALAWFGANMLSSPAQYWTFYQSLLMVGVVSNLAFFIAGLAPAGWIRARKG